MTALTRGDWIGGAIGMFVVLPSVSSFALGLIVLGYQAAHWLQFAVWPEVTLREGLAWGFGAPIAVSSTGYLGVDELLKILLDKSLSSVALTAPFVLVAITIAIFAVADMLVRLSK